MSESPNDSGESPSMGSSYNKYKQNSYSNYKPSNEDSDIQEESVKEIRRPSSNNSSKRKYW